MPTNIPVNAKVGKKLLKICMGDLYPNPLVVFREYVQNSCDSLQEAERTGLITDPQEKIISITINPNSITVHDRGVGVKKDDVKRHLIDLSYSSKGDESIGQYGIGRFTGAKYCNKLIFETSAKDEPCKSIVTFDAKRAREIIESESDYELTEVMDAVTTHQTDVEDSDLHYFRVTMKSINDDHLLDTDGVRDYLSMTIPVQYEEAFLDEVLMPAFEKEPDTDYFDYFSKLPQCTVRLNDIDVRKPYDTLFKNSQNKNEKVGKAKLFKLKNEDDVLAWGWYSMSASAKQFISEVPFRKIRLRKLNMTIGDDTTLDSLYQNEADPTYFVGEIHVLHEDIEPTTGREGLSDSQTKKLFERRLKEQFKTMRREYYDLSKFGSEGIVKFAQAIQTTREINKQLAAGMIEEVEARESLRRLSETKEKAEEAIKSFHGLLKKRQREDLVEELISYYQTESNDAIDKHNSERTVQKSNTIIQRVNLKSEIEKLVHSDTPTVPDEKEKHPKTDKPEDNKPPQEKEPTELDIYDSLTQLEKSVVKKVYHILNNEKGLDDKTRGKIKHKIEKALIK